MHVFYVFMFAWSITCYIFCRFNMFCPDFVCIYWMCLCLCAIRREIQRLENEHEELLRTLGISSTDASVVQDLTAMLAREDRIDEEMKAEKDKLTSLKEQVKHVFLWPAHRTPHSKFILMLSSQLNYVLALFLDFEMGEEVGSTEDEWRSSTP